LVIFSLIALITIHELGHFLFAKKFGVKVEEFGIFLPPRIWGKKIGETIYSINWIPAALLSVYMAKIGKMKILKIIKIHSLTAILVALAPSPFGRE